MTIKPLSWDDEVRQGPAADSRWGVERASRCDHHLLGAATATPSHRQIRAPPHRRAQRRSWDRRGRRRRSAGIAANVRRPWGNHRWQEWGRHEDLPRPGPAVPHWDGNRAEMEFSKAFEDQHGVVRMNAEKCPRPNTRDIHTVNRRRDAAVANMNRRASVPCSS
jgi:hypothetical protein